MLTIGLVINPLAGVGGPLGYKGSDDLSEKIKTQYLNRCSERVSRTFEQLKDRCTEIKFLTAPNAMGESLLQTLPFEFSVLAMKVAKTTCAEDTRLAVVAMEKAKVDLIIFAGGDGTARDLCAVLSPDQAVLGIPAGVKMHSGVFALNPEAAAQIITLMLDGKLVDIREQEVRDIDEQAFREGQVRSRYFGELRVPAEGRFVQRVKNSGREVETLVLDDIAAEFLETMTDDELYIFGPGSTTRAITDALNVDSTLLGIDLVLAGASIAVDVNEHQILTALKEHAKAILVVTPIGGQGYILGRGNQQLSPAVLSQLGKKNIRVVSTKTKLMELDGRPLLLDTNDPQLDELFSGFIEVITGYRETVYYPLSRS